MAEQYKKPLPPLDELERIIGPPSGNEAECDFLCERLNTLWDEYQATKDPRIVAEIRAIVREMKALHCRPCLAR